MNEIHTLTVNGESFLLQDAQARESLANLENEVLINNTDRIEAEEALSQRVDALEADYRHIVTVTNDTGEGVTQIDITQDKDGNSFACSEIFIYATIPPATGEQFYVGTQMWKWIFFSGSIKSKTNTRTLTFQLKHTGGGWWQCKALRGDNITNPEIGIYAADRVLENFRSYVNSGEKVESLCIYGGNSPFPNGTVFEIYGK